ncbi:MAG: hypothetical protein F2663_03430 [Actinobacteria bacterium]|uniref:Unannotated protein n=1 Tax=freshwater metagenome TaxID=449393 RepID=A0A6J6P1P7_9ZZZZ|nr:hypothetical protein [Actinomycetota bacterium]
MSLTEELEATETESARVERWRAETLMRVGYDAASAAGLAARSDIDLHRAIELIEAGCPAETALRILL